MSPAWSRQHYRNDRTYVRKHHACSRKTRHVGRFPGSVYCTIGRFPRRSDRSDADILLEFGPLMVLVSYQPPFPGNLLKVIDHYADWLGESKVPTVERSVTDLDLPKTV